MQMQMAQDDIDEKILQEREEEIIKINQSVVKVRLLSGFCPNESH
jgi:hypothetical protein